MRFWQTKDWASLRRTTRTRFAPSPTGDLHLGGALCALASELVARGAGAFVVRMEDLDPPRVVAGSAARILDDLAWLGLAGDEGPRAGGPVGPYVQSARFARYAAAVDALAAAGRTYACDCSRSEIMRVASAPHEGDDVIYPGTCREKDPTRAMRRLPAIRFRGEGVDDFVLRRADGVFSYQLAVSVDDLEMAIACVVRGADLAPSTPRQLAIMRALGARDDDVPTYVHLPLVRDASGERIAKRTAGSRVCALREAGISAEEIRATLEPFTDGHAPFVIPAAWQNAG
ncbi:MAG TPA: glutamate--tRNA ligase family protein [Polyangiaceae bacterium]